MSENNISAEETKSLVLVGVGGQGILLASEIIARTIMASGYDVKMNEIHGMAQRGGSVVAQIRFGRDVASPLVPKHSARALVALEKIEVLRFVDYLADDGLAVVSDQEIIPVSASGGKIPYPALGEEDIRKVCPNLIYVHAIKLAEELGNARAANTILLGVMSNVLHFPEENWKESIRSCVKPKFVDVNIKAFEIGRAMK
ncbi:MAG: indolepyruvate oxidoreductase subunit beta [Thermoguttaceae bacterium]|nr:indolepyruvate oxidoreductase subunit beta [Thermoguttaceae bacterium]MBQ2683826.1 indolepyruvate oxidoreductase subunit beta [Thermoguttaceae bacterium]MBQ6618611.1 indolepyruvate oxidoreductase subunit beta [Thermoguttaceae bacterium]MBR2584283.1 indolepyruvate oxidoreductase subunit beta [Thermoguttaceae bacterium]